MHRKLSELTKSKKWQRSFFENCPYIMYTLCEDGAFTSVNPAFEKITGWSSSEWIGKPFSGIIHPDDLPLAIKKFQQAIQGQTPAAFEVRVVSKSGRCLVEECTLISLIKSGTEAKIFGIARDITEHKEVAEALRESGKRYRTLVENIDLGITLIDTNHKIVMTNAAMGRLFHKPASEIVGKECFREFEKRDAVCLHCPGTKAMAIRRSTEVETEGIRDDGSRVSAKIYAFPVFGLDGAVTGFIKVVEDITERKRAEEVLKESEEKFRKLASSAQDAIIMLDNEGKFFYWNKAFERIFRYSVREISGKEVHTLIAPERYHENYKKGFARFRETGEGPFIGKTLELAAVKKDGTEFPIELSVSGLQFKGKWISIGILRDITERKRTEEKIRTYQKQLRSLASRLSLIEEQERHRIATDLHDHIGQTLAISKIKLGALQELLSSANLVNEVEEIRELIEQAIRYSRSLTFDLSPPILYELSFEAAVEWLVEEFQKKHGIRIHFEKGQQCILMDTEIRIFLFQVMRELFTNVAKHAQARTIITSIHIVDGYGRISVEDDGIGFDTTEINSFLLKGSFGLFSIRERLRHIGGYIEIISNPGHGCRITMVVPLTVKEKSTKGERHKHTDFLI